MEFMTQIVKSSSKLQRQVFVCMTGNGTITVVGGGVDRQDKRVIFKNCVPL